MGFGTGAGVGRALRVGVAIASPWMLGLCLATVAGAQDAESPEASRSQAFQAVEGAVQEDIAGGPLLLATYGIIWLVLFAYMFRLVGLQKRTRAELESLKAALGPEGRPSGE